MFRITPYRCHPSFCSGRACDVFGPTALPGSASRSVTGTMREFKDGITAAREPRRREQNAAERSATQASCGAPRPDAPPAAATPGRRSRRRLWGRFGGATAPSPPRGVAVSQGLAAHRAPGVRLSIVRFPLECVLSSAWRMIKCLSPRCCVAFGVCLLGRTPALRSVADHRDGCRDVSTVAGGPRPGRVCGPGRCTSAAGPERCRRREPLAGSGRLSGHRPRRLV